LWERAMRKIAVSIVVSPVEPAMGPVSVDAATQLKKTKRNTKSRI